MRSFGAKVSAAVSIGVEVGDRMLLELRGVSFTPLGRSQQTLFLTIPKAVNHGALGLPTLLQQFSESACLFQFRARSGERVFGSVHPGIVMIASNHPLIGIFCSGDMNNY